MTDQQPSAWAIQAAREMFAEGYSGGQIDEEFAGTIIARLHRDGCPMACHKMFPIQKAPSIPWPEAEKAYRTYATHYGTSQSLERLAERGGFGIQEFACLWGGHEPGSCNPTCKFPEFELLKVEVERDELNAAVAELREALIKLQAALPDPFLCCSSYGSRSLADHTVECPQRFAAGVLAKTAGAAAVRPAISPMLFAMASADLLAQKFHEVYERLAPSFGYQTRKQSAQPWAEVPAENKALMAATCQELLEWMAGAVPSEREK